MVVNRGFNHLIPYLIMIGDVMLTSIALIPVQVIWGLLMALIYAIMDFIIVKTGHEESYPLLFDWKSYVTGLTIIGFESLIAIGFLIGYMITRNNKASYEEIKDICISNSTERERK